MYATHSAAATDMTTSSGQQLALTVFPNNKGEVAYYNFTFSNLGSAAIKADQEVWIWFPYQYYDYYVGSVVERYTGRADADN
jgi:hypothetical protein